jgi:Fe-S oxidoreductase
VFDPRDPRFLDEAEVEKELKRVFQLCHGCRLCFSFCPSFPELFERIDAHEERGEGEAEALTPSEMGKVVDLCFQCKLCYVKCPYTPPHAWGVDFPRLVLRAKAARAKREGVSAQDRFLGDPDRLGRMAAIAPSVANWVSENRLLRKVMEARLGIHHERNLPRFHSPTYATWHEKHARMNGDRDAASTTGDTVVLYSTCAVNYNEPDIGVAATQVLERNGKRVLHRYEGCCGMPHLDGGDIDRAVAAARSNLRALAPLAREGLPILVAQPTCGYMLKAEYPSLLPDDEEAQAVSAATLDLCEYLLRLHRERKLDTSFSAPQGTIAYHAPCHLRAQNIGLPARELLGLIPDTRVELVEKCSAFDGTWGMKTEYYELSMKYAGKLNRAIEEAAPARVASDCRLAGLNMTKGIGRTPAHPVQILRDAYGLEPSYPYDDPPRASGDGGGGAQP